jgi:DNA polymerase-3 subunit alpha
MVLYLEYIKEITTKNDKKMAFLKCSDEFGSIDIVIFPNLYENINIENKSILYVSGRVEKNMSRYQLVASNLKKI